ncbi:MAG: PQQ-dependent sugar dehydrogenase [Chloroflexota bacterium]
MGWVVRSRFALAATAMMLALSCLLVVTATPAAYAAPSAQQASRFFQETGFAVDNEAFFAHFQSRGGVSTFGYPVSREFRLQGFGVQVFQRGVMQQAPDGSVRLLNLLDEGLMPVASINFAQFPGPDPDVLAAVPDVAAPDYGAQMVAFIQANVPDLFEGQPVNFLRTFNETVPALGIGPGMRALLNLEIWGAPLSRPARDPNNPAFVYQRFQRGVLHFDAVTGTTGGLLLGDWFKSVLTGQGLPADLEQQMQGSPYLRQYDNGRPLGLARPEVLPNSDLSAAFDAQQAPLERPFQPTVEVVATGLVAPWALAFAPDGRLFFTERPGRIRVIEDGQLQQAPVASLGVASTGEAGLMGLALSPTFQQDGLLYVMYTYRGSQGELLNRISRLSVQGNQAGGEQVLLEGIPGSGIHDGGRLKLGPDGKLYATTGDAANPALAQSGSSLAGKVLRMNPDGSVPNDNPFPGSPVYSLGHRNAQGLAWQPGTGRLYATEHGPSGNDEVNLIEPGQNYGWPTIQGQQQDARFAAPLALYSPSVAPAGAVFYDAQALAPWQGNLFFTTLAGRHLHRLVLGGPDGRQVLGEERLFDGVYGRLRDVAQGPDGFLYFTTSNRDGRGTPSAQDDRILRVVPGGGQALLYPDLRALPPTDLSFGAEILDEAQHNILRFATIVWNAGEGPLELRERRTADGLKVYQRVYDAEGAYVEFASGGFAFNDAHSHWHLDDFARYELWTRDRFAAWQAGDRAQGEPEWRTDKTSFCLMDVFQANDLPASPAAVVYPSTCEPAVQGVSVGWADVYPAALDGQWIDLGTAPLPDGEYVLRVVADPTQLIRESEGGADPRRDGEEANAALVVLAVEGGRIVSLAP